MQSLNKSYLIDCLICIYVVCVYVLSAVQVERHSKLTVDD